ncbi:Transposon Tf2-9 polyprotein [Dictyocoela muelleri]|nr:Transposon Tf2-9 polyprotein [Dictyocoela muelleri]
MCELFNELHFVKIFLDDILIFSKSKKDHEIHLITVLKRLWDTNIKINSNKSEFFKSEIVYLKQIINGDFIKPDVSKLSNVKRFGVPKNKKQLMKIIGSIQWFRPYIHNLSDKINPLTSKLKNEMKFKWDEKDTSILNNIYECIENPPKLHYPDLSEPFKLFTDARMNAIGSILIQNNKIISLYSNKLSEVEKRYTSAEKEMLSAYNSLQNFKNIILGSKILVYTDNKNIVSNSYDPIKRIERWKMTLQEFDYSMNYYQRKLNCGADTLSRMLMIGIPQTQDKHHNIMDKILKNGKINEFGKFKLDKNKENETLKYLHEILGHHGITGFYNTLKIIIETDYLKKR